MTRAQDLASRDPVTRRDAVRRLIRALADERRVYLSRLARLTDHSQQRFDRLMRDGERAALPLADLPVLIEELGVQVLAPFAELAGHRLAPVVRHEVRQEEAMTSVAGLMREAGEAVAALSAALADGEITPAEEAQVRRELDELERQVAQVRAQLSARVLPFLASRR